MDKPVHVHVVSPGQFGFFHSVDGYGVVVFLPGDPHGGAAILDGFGRAAGLRKI